MRNRICICQIWHLSEIILKIKIRITVSWNESDKEFITDLEQRIHRILKDNFMQTYEKLKTDRLTQTYHLRKKHDLQLSSIVKLD